MIKKENNTLNSKEILRCLILYVLAFCNFEFYYILSREYWGGSYKAFLSISMIFFVLAQNNLHLLFKYALPQKSFFDQAIVNIIF